MEAGLEHLSWAGGTLRHVDLLLVVIGPSRASLVTATRTADLAGDLDIPRTVLVGNRLAPADREPLERLASDRALDLLTWLPEDAAIRRADRLGVCPLDHAPEAPGVRAIHDLSRRLTPA